MQRSLWQEFEDTTRDYPTPRYAYFGYGILESRVEEQVGRLVREVDRGFKRLEPMDADGRSSYVRRRTGRKIDHVAVLVEAGEWTTPRVLWKLDISGH